MAEGKNVEETVCVGGVLFQEQAAQHYPGGAPGLMLVRSLPASAYGAHAACGTTLSHLIVAGQQKLQPPRLSKHYHYPTAPLHDSSPTHLGHLPEQQDAIG